MQLSPQADKTPVETNGIFTWKWLQDWPLLPLLKYINSLKIRNYFTEVVKTSNYFTNFKKH